MHTMTPCDCCDPAHAQQAPRRDLSKEVAASTRGARYTDPVTSHAAAASVQGKSFNEGLIWSALLRLGEIGGTCYEIARKTGGKLDHVQVDRSTKVLAEKGWIKATGKTRPGDSGRECQVFVALRPDYGR